jgi:hypothetical protein
VLLDKPVLVLMSGTLRMVRTPGALRLSLHSALYVKATRWWFIAWTDWQETLMTFAPS